MSTSIPRTHARTTLSFTSMGFKTRQLDTCYKWQTDINTTRSIKMAQDRKLVFVVTQAPFKYNEHEALLIRIQKGVVLDPDNAPAHVTWGDWEPGNVYIGSNMDM